MSLRNFIEVEHYERPTRNRNRRRNPDCHQCNMEGMYWFERTWHCPSHWQFLAYRQEKTIIERPADSAYMEKG